VEGIILAGGYGTRLRSVVPDAPKPMALIQGKPFLSLVLDRLVTAGFDRAVLAVGYRYEVIQSYFGERYGALKLSYSVESAPLGTGGAIRLALPLTNDSDVFVINGDTFLEVDYAAMLAAHRCAGGLLSIAVCRVADAGRYGVLELADGKIRRFREKGVSGPGWMNAGVYVVARQFDRYFPPEDAFSFEQDLLVPKVRAFQPIAFITSGLFIDIGIPEDYARAQTLLQPAAG